MGLFGGGHNTTISSNKISNFTVSTAEYGSTVPEILGTTRISPNVIYYDDFTAHEHRESQKSGFHGSGDFGHDSNFPECHLLRRLHRP